MNHSKQILALLAMSGLFVACVPKFPQDREAILRQAQELNDSINRLMQSGDSAKLADAMFLHDQLLQLDTVRDHQFRYIMQSVSRTSPTSSSIWLLKSATKPWNTMVALMPSSI